MNIQLDSPSRPIHLSKSLSAQADGYVAHGSGGSAETHPFRRKIDFWVMSISYAVFLGVSPVETAPQDMFVRISKNTAEGPSLHDDIQTALIALHIAEYEDVDIDELDLDPSAIIDTADRYAEAGAPALLNRLQEYVKDIDVLPYQGMAEMLIADHETAQAEILAIPS